MRRTRPMAVIPVAWLWRVLLLAVVTATLWIGAGEVEAGGQEPGEPRARRSQQTLNRTRPRRAAPPLTIKAERQARKRAAQAAAAETATVPARSNPTSVAQAPEPPATPTSTAVEPGLPLETLQRLFRRPASLVSVANPETALGARLFREPKLSADHKMSCASCHDPAQSFNDGRRVARSNSGGALKRNTPSLWNVGAGKAFYWDGRAADLEAQIKDAVERDGEMDATLEAAVVWLARDPSYRQAFDDAFVQRPSLTTKTVVAALATYERALLSPVTRFDRWIEGDATALSSREQAGFRLFTGKAQCLACHGGWRFTDDDFHDIGLRSTDRGRAALPGITAAGRAFKTPSLREATWSAPYMHDGSLATLDAVVSHYAGALQRRPSLAPELKRRLVLTPQDRADLVAFLKTISSDSRPQAP